MIDFESIANRLGFESDDLLMLFSIFNDSAKESISDLKSSIKDNDFTQIKSLAHSIKGSAANLMLEDIETLAQTIESSAKNQENIDYLLICKQLEEKLKELEPILA